MFEQYAERNEADHNLLLTSQILMVDTMSKLETKVIELVDTMTKLETRVIEIADKLDGLIAVMCGLIKKPAH